MIFKHQKFIVPFLLFTFLLQSSCSNQDKNGNEIGIYDNGDDNIDDEAINEKDPNTYKGSNKKRKEKNSVKGVRILSNTDNKIRLKGEVGLNRLMAEKGRNLLPNQLSLIKTNDKPNERDMEGLDGPYRIPGIDYFVGYKLKWHAKYGNESTYIWRSNRPIYSWEGVHIIKTISETANVKQTFHVNTGGHGGKRYGSNPRVYYNGDIEFTKDERMMIEQLSANVSILDVNIYNKPLIPIGANHVVILWCWAELNTPINSFDMYMPDKK